MYFKPHIITNPEDLKKEVFAWREDCLKIYDGQNGYGKFTDVDKRNHKKLVEDMLKFQEKIYLSDMEIFFENSFIDTIREIIKRYTASQKQVRLILLENISWAKMNNHNNIILFNLLHFSECVSYETRIMVAIENNWIPNFITDYNRSTYANLYGLPQIYEELNFELYDVVDKEWHNNRPKIMGSHQHKSWFINNLLNSNKTLVDLKKLIILSIIPVKYLKLFYMNKLIPDDLLCIVDCSLPTKFEYLIYTSNEDSVLEYRLFNINNTELIKYHDAFNKFTKLFSQE